jgi:hypothetical protein
MNITRTILTTTILLIVSKANFAQTKEQELSNAEKFSAKAGALIQKEFLELGSVGDAKISVIYFTDLITNTKQSALKFEYESAGKYSSSTKAAVLDADEIDGLIKSIKIIQDKIFPTATANYTEVSFKSRGGFDAGCYWSKGTWSTYLKLEKYDKDSYVFLNREDFTTLLGLLEQAKTKL